MDTKNVYRVRINDSLECVLCEDQSVDLFDLQGRVVALSSDDAYKLYSCLHSLFCATPTVEHSDNSF